MNIFFSLIDESAARVIVRWRYEPPYDIYNLRDSAESIQYALDLQNHFYIMRSALLERMVKFLAGITVQRRWILAWAFDRTLPDRATAAIAGVQC